MRRLIGVVALVGVAAGCSSSSPPSVPSPSSPAGSAGSGRASESSPTSSKQADQPLPDSATLLKEASATTRDLTSAHLVLSVTGKIEQMPVKTLDGDVTNKPAAAARGNATITVMGSEVDIKFVVFGGHLYAMLPGSDWHDYGPTSNVYDVTTTLNPDSGLANVLTNFIDPKAEARETVAGQQTIRIAGKVAASAVNKLVPQLDTTKRMPSTVWVQESGDHQLVQAELEPGKDDSIEMVLSNWNVPVAVQKPPRASS